MIINQDVGVNLIGMLNGTSLTLKAIENRVFKLHDDIND